MALHFVGFKLCTLMLGAVGFNLQLSSLLAPARENVGLTVLYLFFGLVFPLVFIVGFRWTKKVFGILFKRLWSVRN